MNDDAGDDAFTTNTFTTTTKNNDNSAAPIPKWSNPSYKLFI